ncbi:MAG: hypothetical protein FWG94_06580, partial [Oscillospiraceae bacterium]|nr:hypothetical protein [Oscillospiraceae bacterium]
PHIRYAISIPQKGDCNNRKYPAAYAINHAAQSKGGYFFAGNNQQSLYRFTIAYFRNTVVL